MSTEEIEQKLAVAEQRLKKALQALAVRWKSEEQAEFEAAHEAKAELDRALVDARGEEYAIAIEFPVKWCAGAPLPHLFTNDYLALLCFILREPTPEWNGENIEIVDPAAEQERPLALVEFKHCISAKLGSPNDEVFHGHPLEGRGLEGYTAQQVINSRWLAELEAINKVHQCYEAKFWRKKKHYILWFHDSTFECIAESFTVEQHRESMPAMMARMCRRLQA